MDNILMEFEVLQKNLDNLPIENLADYDLSKTALFIVDINNGFAKEGALYSDRIKSLITPIYEFVKPLEEKLNKIIAFTDTHDKNSVELNSYPEHCLVDTEECKVVDELLNIKNLEIIPKNSTNGFFAMDVNILDDIDNVVVVGDCTDICIYQFAVTLKAYFNEKNINKNIVVPMNLVDTYDIPFVHPGDLLNIVFLNSMLQNGVKLIKKFSL
ncbi:MAG: isochorismatase family protein [Intestinibacter sp.]|uniref:isochorismatase family cysteine hydrolase n=1 Tax=Intestinibacter sp. TaxID=1965304 RepID=UPI0025BA8675|nr:isochorismatase family cysteine hydrolase [Intestinibacter sp.]MCI6737972.1 isochorismatase family protein [Intestinibacter sp.]